MKSFRTFISFVKKEFSHILRDTRTLMVLLVMPVVMILLFGFALSTELKSVKVAVYAPSMDLITERIVTQVDASPYFTVSHYIKERSGFERVMLSNKAQVIIAFEENFYHRVVHDGQGAIQILVDGTDMNIGQMASFYLNSIIASCRQELMMESMLNATETLLPPVMINVNTKMLYNPQMKSSFNFVPGVMGMILMLVCAMMTSVSIVREKQRGTMEVLLVSPVKPVSIILAKAIPYFTLSVVNLVTIIFLSVHLLKVPLSGSLFWVIVVSMLFIMVSLSLGIFVSTIVNTQEEAILISSMVFMLPTLLLSGMLFPIESIPVVLQYVSHFIPAKWYIEAMKVMMIQGLDIRYCMDSVLILCGFLVVIVSASILTFKNRL
ncbi:MAG: ABC transporter permease [Candidatus Coprenecus sp.]|nr:ABC transporter permease [Candidatus Coprenecus sp.]